MTPKLYLKVTLRKKMIDFVDVSQLLELSHDPLPSADVCQNMLESRKDFEIFLSGKTFLDIFL